MVNIPHIPPPPPQHDARSLERNARQNHENDIALAQDISPDARPLFRALGWPVRLLARLVIRLVARARR